MWVSQNSARRYLLYERGMQFSKLTCPPVPDLKCDENRSRGGTRSGVFTVVHHCATNSFTPLRRIFHVPVALGVGHESGHWSWAWDSAVTAAAAVHHHNPHTICVSNDGVASKNRRSGQSQGAVEEERMKEK